MWNQKNLINSKFQKYKDEFMSEMKQALGPVMSYNTSTPLGSMLDRLAHKYAQDRQSLEAFDPFETEQAPFIPTSEPIRFSAEALEQAQRIWGQEYNAQEEWKPKKVRCSCGHHDIGATDDPYRAHADYMRIHDHERYQFDWTPKQDFTVGAQVTMQEQWGEEFE
jgi:hypothetical protein